MTQVQLLLGDPESEPLAGTLKGLPRCAEGRPLGALGSMNLSLLKGDLPLPVAVLLYLWSARRRSGYGDSAGRLAVSVPTKSKNRGLRPARQFKCAVVHVPQKVLGDSSRPVRFAHWPFAQRMRPKAGKVAVAYRSARPISRCPCACVYPLHLGGARALVGRLFRFDASQGQGSAVEVTHADSTS